MRHFPSLHHLHQGEDQRGAFERDSISQSALERPLPNQSVSSPHSVSMATAVWGERLHTGSCLAELASTTALLQAHSPHPVWIRSVRTDLDCRDCVVVLTV